MSNAMAYAIRTFPPVLHRVVDGMASPLVTSLVMFLALLSFIATEQAHTRGGYSPWAPTMSTAYLASANQ